MVPQRGVRRAKASNLLQIGELFHQLFHAVAGEKDGELGVFAVAFAQEDGAFAVFCVADVLTFSQAGSAFRLRKVNGRTGKEPGFAPKKRAMLSMECASGSASALLTFGLRSLLVTAGLPVIQEATKGLEDEPFAPAP